MRNYRKCIYTVLGTIFVIHYVSLLFFNANVKYDLVKYHLLRTAIESQLSLILEESKNPNRGNSIRHLRDQLRNPYVEIINEPISVENCQSDLVCDEHYLGNLAAIPWHENAWTMDPNCTKSIDHLLSIVLIYGRFTLQIIENIRKKYPKIPIIIGYIKHIDTIKSINWPTDKKLSWVKLSTTGSFNTK